MRRSSRAKMVIMRRVVRQWTFCQLPDFSLTRWLMSRLINCWARARVRVDVGRKGKRKTQHYNILEKINPTSSTVLAHALRIRPFPTSLHFSQRVERKKLAFDEVRCVVVVFFLLLSRRYFFLNNRSRWSALSSRVPCHLFSFANQKKRRCMTFMWCEVVVIVENGKTNLNSIVWRTPLGAIIEITSVQAPQKPPRSLSLEGREFVFHFKSLWVTERSFLSPPFFSVGSPMPFSWRAYVGT